MNQREKKRKETKKRAENWKENNELEEERMARSTSDRWIDMEEIGGGAYGVVFRARDRRKLEIYEKKIIYLVFL